MADMNFRVFLSNSEGVAGTSLAPMHAKPAIFRDFFLFMQSSPEKWFDTTTWLLLVIPAG
jgi:hypothetical protein